MKIYRYILLNYMIKYNLLIFHSCFMLYEGLWCRSVDIYIEHVKYNHGNPMS